VLDAWVIPPGGIENIVDFKTEVSGLTRENMTKNANCDLKEAQRR
jgi:hypothetical protein